MTSKLSNVQRVLNYFHMLMMLNKGVQYATPQILTGVLPLSLRSASHACEILVKDGLLISVDLTIAQKNYTAYFLAGCVATRGGVLTLPYKPLVNQLYDAGLCQSPENVIKEDDIVREYLLAVIRNIPSFSV